MAHRRQVEGLEALAGIEDLLARLEIMSLMGGIDLPLAAIRGQIAGAIDLIVHQARHASGRRSVSSIVEVTGLDCDVVQTQELFRLGETAGGPLVDDAGVHQGCGQTPAFYEQLRAAGVTADTHIFYVGSESGGVACSWP